VTRTAALAVLIVGLMAGETRAQTGPHIVVFPAEGQAGGKLAKAPAAITSAVADAARKSGAEVDISKGSAADAITLAGCDAKDPACLGKVAATMDADLVVVISVAPADSGVFVDIDVGKRDAPEPTRANWILDGADVAAVQAAAAKEADRLFSGSGAAATTTASDDPRGPATPTGLDLRDDTGPAPTRAPAEDQPSAIGRVRWYAWGATGVGVALMVGGGVFLVGASNKQDEIDRASTTSLSDFRELESLEDDAASQARWGSIMLGAGILATGIGVTLAVLEMRSSPDETDTVSIAPAAFDHGAGVALTLVGDL
jgi:hypothetical protein